MKLRHESEVELRDQDFIDLVGVVVVDGTNPGYTIKNYEWKNIWPGNWTIIAEGEKTTGERVRLWEHPFTIVGAETL